MEFHPESAARLAELYRLLRQHFGYAHPWWPGTPFQVSITAVLVQQCDWSVAFEAVLRMDAAGIGSLPKLAELPLVELQDMIRKVTFAPTKSARLLAIAERLVSQGYDSFEEFLAPGRETQSLRAELLSFPGIGPETADCLLNFASTHPVFVVDAYTRRIFERVNPAPYLPVGFWKKGTYPELQEFFQMHLLSDLGLYNEFDFSPDLPRDVALLRDYHALLVELGKHHCLRTNPHCHKTGKRGWSDYVHCLSHCLPQKCTACPLVKVCRFPMK